MAQATSRDFGAEMAGAEQEVVEPGNLSELQPRHRPSMKVKFQDVFKTTSNDEEEGGGGGGGGDQPERLMMETMAMRPRAMSHHLMSTEIPSRKWLLMKARFWRSLMTFGMTFHDWCKIRAPKQSFIRRISTDTIPIELYFYVPKDYKQKIKSQPNHRYPLVVNFHGGGFCLGHATDDRYWARIILKSTPAVFVSIGYRRAPEHPFPQPIDDCVEALLYLQTHQDDLHVDPSQIALSGFSAGANLAFTVPFRLTYQYEKQPSSEHLPLDGPQKVDDSNFVPEPEPEPEPGSVSPVRITSEDRQEQQIGLLAPLPGDSDPPTKQPSPWSSNIDLQQINTNRSGITNNNSRTNLLNIPGPRSYLLRGLTQQSRFSEHNNHSKNNVSSQSTDSLLEATRHLRIVSVVAWYPLLDWTSSRSEKKRGSRNPKKTLPAVFTDLFDFAYLPAPDHEGHHCSPYASPSLAPDHMIVDGLPQRIQMWLCEWDMLLAEGEKFSNKLHRLGKAVTTEVIPSVPHGWDKSPNPFRDQKRTDELYERAAAHLRGVFGAAERRDTIGEGIGLGGLR